MNKLTAAWDWVRANRKTVLAVAVVAIPLISRAIPAFPADELVSVLRAFLGA